MRFKCSSCDEWHEGVPGFSTSAPYYYFGIDEGERDRRCELTSDTCVIDDDTYFVRGSLELPVHGEAEPFIWGVWVSLSEDSFSEYMSKFESPERACLGPYFGWLSANLEVYPDTESLKTRLHPRELGTRPFIELEPTDHPLAIEQRNGISIERVAEIYSFYMKQEAE